MIEMGWDSLLGFASLRAKVLNLKPQRMSFNRRGSFPAVHGILFGFRRLRADFRLKTS
jgi:hypothetical protein